MVAKGRNAETPAEMKVMQEQLKQLLADNQALQAQVIAMQAAGAPGGVPLINPDPEAPPAYDGERLDAAGLPRVSLGRREPDLGPEYIVRVQTARVPANMRTVQQVTLCGSDRHGEPFEFSRLILTNVPIKLPLAVIRHLETPIEEEFVVPPASPAFQAFLLGDLEPAHLECKRKGYERVVQHGSRLRYVRYIRVYTVVREFDREGSNWT